MHLCLFPDTIIHQRIVSSGLDWVFSTNWTRFKCVKSRTNSHKHPPTEGSGSQRCKVNFSWETVEPPVRRSDVSVLLTGPWRAIGPCSPSGAITSAPYIYETLAFSFFHTISFLYWFAQFLFPTIPCCISFPLLSLFLCFSFLTQSEETVLWRKSWFISTHSSVKQCHYKIMLENIYFNTEMKWYQGM